ncbi:MAG: hypothetical protein ACTSYD_06045 [Candidatus Heimdallarchaeaceae archaeon]
MTSWRNIEYQKIIEEANAILGHKSERFLKNLEKYNVKIGEPDFDLCCFIEYYTLFKAKDEKRLEQWKAFWNKYAKRVSYGNLFYNPVIYANHFVNLIDEDPVKNKRRDAIQIVEAFLEKEKQYQIKLSWETYLAYFFERKADLRPRFSNKEFDIFLKIIEKQTSEPAVIAPLVNMDNANYSRYRKVLQDRLLFVEKYQLNFRALNLVTAAIFIENAPTLDLFPLLKKSPYLYSIYTSSINKKHLIFYLIPNRSEVFDDFYRLADKLQKRLKIESVKVITTYRNATRIYNYQAYDHRKGRWKYEKNSFLFGISGKISEEWKPIFIHELNGKLEEEITIDRDGIRMLNFLNTHYFTSLREFSEELNISFTQLVKRMEIYKKLRVIFSRTAPSYLYGLENISIKLDEPWSKLNDINQRFAFLPETFSARIKISNKEKLLFVVRVPKEHISLFYKMIEVTFKDKIEDMFIVSNMYSRIFTLPGDEYNTLWGSWDYETKDLITF